MKWMTVGLLAMLGLTACGVGVGDPEGQAAAAGVNTQAVQTVYVDQNGNVIAYSGETTANPTAPGSGGTNELPQDPVPLHGGSPNVIVVNLASGASATHSSAR
jgi:hypothetical protein